MLVVEPCDKFSDWALRAAWPGVPLAPQRSLPCHSQHVPSRAPSAEFVALPSAAVLKGCGTCRLNAFSAILVTHEPAAAESDMPRLLPMLSCSK